MRNRMYGGVRGRKTKVGEKLLRFPPTRFVMQVNSSLFVLHSQLHERSNDFLTSAWEHVDDWNLWHGVVVYDLQ